MRFFNLVVALLRLTIGIAYCSIGVSLRDLSLTLLAGTEVIMCLLAIGNAWTSKAMARGLAGVACPLLYLAGTLVVPVRCGPASPVAIVWQLAGCGLLLWSLWALRSSYSVGTPSFVQLRADGPYRFVRHPQALAGMIMRVAFTAEHLCAWNLIVCATLTATIVGSSLLEERFLRQFPEWCQYARRVPFRWLPELA